MADLIPVVPDVATMLLGAFLLFRLWQSGRRPAVAVAFLIVVILMYTAGCSLWSITGGQAAEHWGMKLLSLATELLLLFCLSFPRLYVRSTQFDVL